MNNVLRGARGLSRFQKYASTYSSSRPRAASSRLCRPTTIMSEVVDYGKVKGELENFPYLKVQRRRSGIVSSDLLRESGSGAQESRQHGELSHIDITVHCNRLRDYRFFIYNPREVRGFLHVVEGQSRVFLATARVREA